MNRSRLEQEISARWQLKAPTLVTPAGAAAQMSFSHVRSDVATHYKTKSMPSEDAYVLHMLLTDLPSAQLWYHNKEAPVPYVPKGGFFLFHYPSDPVSAHHSPFDIMRFSISKATLDCLAYDAGQKLSDGLRCFDPGAPDPVLYHLSKSVLPIFERKTSQNQLLLDHISLAYHAYLVANYAETPRAPRLVSGGLAPWQEGRAKELMTSQLDRDVSLFELASECNLSISHFSRAFRRTTGRPPHRWLVEQRVEAAKRKLSFTKLSLTQIAIECGFSDASHFSRTFAKLVGCTPSNWRREAQI